MEDNEVKTVATSVLQVFKTKLGVDGRARRCLKAYFRDQVYKG